MMKLTDNNADELTPADLLQQACTDIFDTDGEPTYMEQIAGYLSAIARVLVAGELRKQQTTESNDSDRLVK